MKDSNHTPTEAGPRRTRHAILDILKWRGASEAAQLGEELGLTAMAVRQHLYRLRAEGVVVSREEPRPLGRPALSWSLTDEADGYFPNGHAELAVGLIDAVRETFGEAGMTALLEKRAEAQIADYRQSVAGAAKLETCLRRLAERRTEEGYLAEVKRAEDGGFLLIENHCPVCAAASVCKGICAMELDVFRATLGPDIEVERTDHILAGARRCAYHVTPRDVGHAPD